VSEFDTSSYHEFPLTPDRHQLKLLEEMMEGPVFLQRLLSMNGERIQTIEQASAFLDKNWKRLVPYMVSRNAAQSPRAMEQLILRLATEDSDTFRLDFPSSCALTAAQEILFPIPDLSAVTIGNHAALAQARKGMKHAGAFTLVRTDTGYFVGIEFERILPPQANVQRQVAKELLEAFSQGASKHQPPPRKKVSPPHRKTGMSAHAFLTSFNNRVTAHLKQQLAVSRQFSTTRFEDLSGWGVSGGLPSLPKRG